MKWKNKIYSGDRNNRKVTRLYAMWRAMRHRVSKNPDYIDVSIDHRFDSYDYFHDWCVTQIGYDCKCEYGYFFEIDKDILGGLAYSPDNCVFIPKELNAFFRRKYSKSEMPRGVQFFKEKKKPYRAYSVFNGNNVCHGYYSSLTEAEEVAKIKRKESLLFVLEKYKGKIDDRVVDAIKIL